MLIKLVSAAIVALIPILFLVGIRYDTALRQANDQAILNQMCPQVWANMDKLRSLPAKDLKQVMAFCPEA